MLLNQNAPIPGAHSDEPVQTSLSRSGKVFVPTSLRPIDQVRMNLKKASEPALLKLAQSPYNFIKKKFSGSTDDLEELEAKPRVKSAKVKSFMGSIVICFV